MGCPEHFPAVQVVKAGAVESMSCGDGSGEQGCAQEPRPAIWPGIPRGPTGAECLAQPEVAAAEGPAWQVRVAQEETAEEEAAETWLRRKVEQQ